MSRWIDNKLADRLYMVNHVSDLKDIDPESIEKDWWVTMVLRQKDLTKEELVQMVKDTMTKEELLSLLLDK